MAFQLEYYNGATFASVPSGNTVSLPGAVVDMHGLRLRYVNQGCVGPESTATFIADLVNTSNSNAVVTCTDLANAFATTTVTFNSVAYGSQAALVSAIQAFYAPDTVTYNSTTCKFSWLDGSPVPTIPISFSVMSSIEIMDLVAEFGPGGEIPYLRARYDTSPRCPISAATFSGLFSAVGDTWRDPTFGYLWTALDLSGGQLNGERAAHNADKTWMLQKTGSNQWTAWNGSGTPVWQGSLSYLGGDPSNQVRPHWSDPNKIWWYHNQFIVTFDIVTNTYATLWTSPHGNIGVPDSDGDSTFDAVNGDANDPSRMTGYFLLSHGSNYQNVQTINLNTGTVVRSFWDGTNWILQNIPWDGASPLYNIPNSPPAYDWSAVFPKGEYVLRSTNGIGTEVTDHNGTPIGVLWSNSGHATVGHFSIGGQLYDGVVMKVTPGLVGTWLGTGTLAGNNATVTTGDLIAVFFEVTWDAAGNRSLNIGYKLAQEHVSGIENQATGGQFSYGFQPGDFRSGIVTAIAEEHGESSCVDPYYSSMFEFGLADFNDRVRHLGHMYQDDENTVSQQPELFISDVWADGWKRAILKTKGFGTLSGDGGLFMIQIPPTTPDSVLLGYGL